MSFNRRRGGFGNRGRKNNTFGPVNDDSDDGGEVVGEVDEDGVEVNRKRPETESNEEGEDEEISIQNRTAKKAKPVVQQQAANAANHELAATLVQAARTGNFEQLKKAIQQGADVNEKVCGCTAVMYASFHGRLDMVQHLIDNGADVNVSNLSGFTSLAWAVERNQPAVVELLLKNGADANQADNCGLTPFHKAARSGFVPICKLLFDVGSADVGQTSKKENGAVSILQEAASSGHFDAVMYLLNETQSDVDLQDAQGRTALIRAVLKNHASITEQLLKYGADVNLADNTGRTSLHWAAFNGNLAIVQLLISNRADLTIVDKTNQTAQQIASIKKHAEVESLFENILQLTANVLNTDNNIEDEDAVDEMFQ